MHIPENYLSPGTCGVLAVAMAPIWYISIQKVKEKCLPKNCLFWALRQPFPL